MTFLALCYYEDDAFAWSFLVETDDAQAIAEQAYRFEDYELTPDLIWLIATGDDGFPRVVRTFECGKHFTACQEPPDRN